MKRLSKELLLLFGVPKNTTSHWEKLISALGAGVGILIVASLGAVAQFWGVLDNSSVYLVVASMGASAVLLFAVPHGALSQPWALLGGHLLSAFVGVSCHRYLGAGALSAAVAVGLAVGGMYYLRCIHPPGGATALTAVMGGEAVHQLGYQFMLVPVLVNVLFIFLVAVIFNGFFSWRRYPAHLLYKRSESHHKIAQPMMQDVELTQEDLSAAIQQHNSFVDITEEGLTDLLELAKQHAQKQVQHPKEIVAGRFYSNGRLGRSWSVRQVVDASDQNQLPSKDKVIFKVVAGDQSYITGICLRDEFKRWARFEVVLRDKRWVKAG